MRVLEEKEREKVCVCVRVRVCVASTVSKCMWLSKQSCEKACMRVSHGKIEMLCLARLIPEGVFEDTVTFRVMSQECHIRMFEDSNRILVLVWPQTHDFGVSYCKNEL